jgi:hypothetical protein
VRRFVQIGRSSSLCSVFLLFLSLFLSSSLCFGNHLLLHPVEEFIQRRIRSVHLVHLRQPHLLVLRPSATSVQRLQTKQNNHRRSVRFTFPWYMPLFPSARPGTSTGKGSLAAKMNQGRRSGERERGVKRTGRQQGRMDLDQTQRRPDTATNKKRAPVIPISRLRSLPSLLLLGCWGDEGGRGGQQVVVPSHVEGCNHPG